MAENWAPNQPRQAPATPAPTDIRTEDGRTTFLVSREVLRPGIPVEHTVEALAAINSSTGKTRKVNYIPYDPFGVPNRQMDHKALVAVFTHEGRLFFSVPEGPAAGRGRRVFLVERERDERQGSISIKSGDSSQSLSLSSRSPLQHHLSTITANELDVAQRLLEPWMHVSEDVAGAVEEVVAKERGATRPELSHSMAFILEEDLTPIEDGLSGYTVSLADLARPALKPVQEKPAATTAAPKVSSTLQLQTIPDAMTANMIAGKTVIEPNQEIPLPLNPAEPEEFAVFGTPREGTAPRDLLRIVVFGGSVATSALEDDKWSDYRLLDKNGLWKGPGRGAGYILSLHQTGASDDNVSISAIRDSLVLARLNPGSTGLDRDRLRNSKTAAERAGVLQAHLERVQANRLKPRGGRGDVLAPSVPMELRGKSTLIPGLDENPARGTDPTQTRTRFALAVGAVLGFAAVAGTAGMVLKSCADDSPQHEASGMTAPDED